MATSNYKCPKCGGSDYFMSQRNVVKGMGWAQRGSIKSIPVCRVCDEIMLSSQMTLTPEEIRESKQALLKSIRLWNRVAKILIPAIIIVFLLALFLS